MVIVPLSGLKSRTSSRQSSPYRQPVSSGLHKRAQLRLASVYKTLSFLDAEVTRASRVYIFEGLHSTPRGGFHFAVLKRQIQSRTQDRKHSIRA